VPVELSTVTRGPLVVSIDHQGMVRVVDRYVIATPVAARVQRIDLRPGDKVAQGDILAWLLPLPRDAKEAQQVRAQRDAAYSRASAAQLESQRAQTNLALASRERARIVQLFDQQFLSRQAADRAMTSEQAAHDQAAAAQARHQAALAELRSARAAVDALGQSAQQTLQLRAPVAGQVLSVTQQSERTLAAGSPLLTLGDPARFEVVIDVLSSDAVKLRPGMQILLDDWGGKSALQARLRIVEPVAFTKISALGVEEQRVNVVADPVGSLAELADGYRVEARIVIWQQDAVLKIPGSSIFRIGEGWHVFIVEQDRAHLRTIQIGQRNRDDVQILSGLDAGMQVVTFPGNQLSEGIKIKAMQ
jgi:HlyD family secretion protein